MTILHQKAKYLITFVRTLSENEETINSTINSKIQKMQKYSTNGQNALFSLLFQNNISTIIPMSPQPRLEDS